MGECTLGHIRDIARDERGKTEKVPREDGESHCSSVQLRHAVGFDREAPFGRLQCRKHHVQECVFGRRVCALDRGTEGAFVFFNFVPGDIVVIAGK